LFYAAGFAGDSQTMTTEAALLGTPSFKCNTFARKLSIPNEIEDQYQLCQSFQPDAFEAFFESIQLTFADITAAKKLWSIRREKLLAEKIDLSLYLTHYLTSDL
jgi:predicted glycosyltransferase